jgi:glycosyltransferase involved in cell wall biosynthesis
VIRSLHIDTARTWRGGQNQVLLTVNGLEELGHPAVLVAHAQGELRRRASEGMRFLPFAPRSEFDIRAAWQLAGIFNDVRPDVVHAHDPHGVALAAMALQMPSAPKRRPLLVAARRVDFHLKQHAFSRWKYRHIDAFIAASGLIARMLVDDGVPADRVVVVHEGVDVSRIGKMPVVDAHKEFWLPHGAPVVGNIAALVPHKGQRHLIAAAARVVRDVPDARFVILGDGELRESLERQIHELGLDRHVTLAGFRDQAIGILKSFDIFVMSSVTEGLGTSILDAMACAVPVVGTTAGGIPESVVDGVTGLLVPPRDEAAMAKAIVTLLKDQALRARLGSAGLQRVTESFGVERMVSETVRVYETFLAKRP